jgi:hypothetical protein
MFSGWIDRQIERDPESAVMYYKKASRRAQRKDGAAAPRTLNLRKEYAVALHRVGRNEEAEAELAAVIAERGPMPNANDKSARSARIWHARLLYELVLQPHLVILQSLSLVVAAAGAFLMEVAPS